MKLFLRKGRPVKPQEQVSLCPLCKEICMRNTLLACALYKTWSSNLSVWGIFVSMLFLCDFNPHDVPAACTAAILTISWGFFWQQKKKKEEKKDPHQPSEAILKNSLRLCCKLATRPGCQPTHGRYLHLVRFHRRNKCRKVLCLMWLKTQ